MRQKPPVTHHSRHCEPRDLIHRHCEPREARRSNLLALILFTLTLLLTFSSPVVSADNADSEWYPFVIPAKLDPNSPVNMGKLVLDPPAGKHGFCKVKDGHFYFEDGTRAKFWGTNLAFNACFPSKKQAEFLADRLAFFGFNAVRFAHLDYYFEPKGIFEDICPAFKDSQMKKTGKLSPKQLDRLDYLIYQLKQHGIYVDFILLCSRFFTEADGIKEAGKLGMAAKPVSMFDRKLIELQKKFAKDLLTHYNPYTKSRYCDDPTIAFIEITNENSILSSWQYNQLNGSFWGLKKPTIPSVYITELDTFWNDWLRRKYKTTENVIRAWASSFPTASGKNSNLSLGGNLWALELHNDSVATKKDINTEQIISINRITDTPWHVNLRYNGVSVSKGTSHLFRFTAKANKEIPISITLQQAYIPWTNLGLHETVKLNQNYQTFEIPFTANENCPNAKIAFLIGYSVGEISLKDISLQAGTAITLQEGTTGGFAFQRPIFKLINFYSEQKKRDIQDFYIDLEKSYFDEMSDYFKKDVGIKIPITGIGGYQTKGNLISQKDCDFIDRHEYWDHPMFPNKPWDKSNFTIHGKSIFTDKDKGIIGKIFANSPINKPFTITEWNHCYPNQFAYETPLLLATQAQKYNWDGAFQFAFTHGWETNPVLDDLQSYFNILPNAQQLILCSLGGFILHTTDNIQLIEGRDCFNISSPTFIGSCGFIENSVINLGPISVKSYNDGVIFLFSIDKKPLSESKTLVLFTIGQMKNRNSGWNNGKFNWGEAPSLMKKIVLEISLGIEKKYRIFELTNSGIIGREIQSNLDNKTLRFSIQDPNSPWFLLTSE